MHQESLYISFLKDNDMCVCEGGMQGAFCETPFLETADNNRCHALRHIIDASES